MEDNFSAGKVNKSAKTSLSELAVFARYLAILLKSGLSITESLEIAAGESRGRLAGALGQIRQSVLSGRTLSESFKEYPRMFPSFLANLAKAGEASGTLAEALERAADALKKDKEMRSKVVGALAYPAIVLAASAIVGIGTVFFILPKIIPMFEGLKSELPLSTRILISVAHSAKKNGLAFALGTPFFLALFRILSAVKPLRPGFDYISLKVPIVGKIRRLSTLSSFCRNLSTFLRSGFGLLEALKECSDAAGNWHYKKSINRMIQRIENGSNFKDALEAENAYFPKILISMSGVGEKSGKLEESLAYAAEMLESKLETYTRTMSGLMEPALLVLIGLFVGGLVLSIITPIYQLTGEIK
jgi:type II secretory pathway component PulF